MQVDVQTNKSPTAPLTVASTRRRGSLRSPHRRALRLGLLFVSPWIAGFLLFFAYPFFATIYYSFTDFNGVGAAHWIGFTNYVNLFHDPLFKTSLFNTFYYTVIELPLSTVAARGLALLFFARSREEERVGVGILAAGVARRAAHEPALRAGVDPGRCRSCRTEVGVVRVAHDDHESGRSPCVRRRCLVRHVPAPLASWINFVVGGHR